MQESTFYQKHKKKSSRKKRKQCEMRSQKEQCASRTSLWSRQKLNLQKVSKVNTTVQRFTESKKFFLKEVISE